MRGRSTSRWRVCLGPGHVADVSWCHSRLARMRVRWPATTTQWHHNYWMKQQRRVAESWTHQICAEIDAEDGDGAKGEGDVGDDEDEEGSDLRDVGRQRVRDRLLQVVEDQTTWGKKVIMTSLNNKIRKFRGRDLTFLNSGDDRSKIVIEQDHVGGLLGHVTSGDSHGNADVSSLESGWVIDSVSSDSHDRSLKEKVEIRRNVITSSQVTSPVSGSLPRWLASAAVTYARTRSHCDDVIYRRAGRCSCQSTSSRGWRKLWRLYSKFWRQSIWGL